MVDLHCHILPGLDDGPATMEEAVAIARAAAASGVVTIVATPHIREDHPFPLELIEERLAEVRQALLLADVRVEIVNGGEVAVSKVMELDDQTLASLCMGNGRYILVESPYTQAPSLLETALFDLQTRGFRPILAHPERSPSFLRDQSRLEHLVEGGILCSITARSIVGGFGDSVRAFSNRLFAAGLVHNIASDAHDVSRRGPGFAHALERLQETFGCTADSMAWFTTTSGRTIVDGKDLLGRPPSLHEAPSGWSRLKGSVAFRRSQEQ